MIIHSLQEFSKYFQIGKPIIAIDYGQKKLGLAISDTNHILAMPFMLITSNNQQKIITKLLTIFHQKEPCALVIGLPINMDSSKSEQSKIVENFASKLAIQTNLPIFMQDERLSSRAADNMLKELGLNRKQRNKRDDLAAASLILETTLESVKKLSSRKL